MILRIDNYDSFTFNPVHFPGDVGGRCEVRRNDALTVPQALAMAPEAIALPPGPRTPNEASICLNPITSPAGRIPRYHPCSRRSVGPSRCPGHRTRRWQVRMHR